MKTLIHATRRRGYVMLDLMAGLMIVGLLLGVLLTATTQRARAARRLGEQLQAARLCQDTLARLQRRQSDPLPDGLKVQALAHPAPPGYQWLRVHAAAGKSSAEMIGLVPAEVRP